MLTFLIGLIKMDDLSSYCIGKVSIISFVGTTIGFSPLDVLLLFISIFFLKISYNLAVILKAMNCLACTSMIEMIDIRLGCVCFFGSSWTRWFNHIKVDEDIVVNVKMGDMVRLNCIPTNKFVMD